MTREVGLWLDYHKAVIVSVEKKNVTTREITSNMERQVRSLRGTRPKTSSISQTSPAEHLQDQQHVNDFDRYYDGIISLICDAESIWIFGPGEAKIELENRLRITGLGARVVGIETIEKITDGQLAAKVQHRFLKKERIDR